MGGLSLILVATIGLVVILKTLQLRKGGKVVALSLGGVRLDHKGATSKQLMFLNVVEEMAIASGVPVPPVYLMDEDGINAFAAGYETSDAVIGVTRGSLEKLNRDQLEGIVAHEFSHILNGDMRLNIRILALLRGIQFISQAGFYLYRVGSSRFKLEGIVRVISMLSFGLIAVGFVGYFFGVLIKSAVSRQREFLADASSVQFTRNPHGIAGALNAIGYSGSQGSEIKHPNAGQMSHMFFSEAVPQWYSRWTHLLDTHPPLLDRIKRVDSSWRGGFVSAKEVSPEPPKNQAQKSLGHMLIQGLQASMTALLVEGGISKMMAPSLVCACLMKDDYLNGQMNLIRGAFTATMLADVERLYEHVKSLSARERLQLLQRATPALKQQTQNQFSALLDLIQEIVNCDEKPDLVQWIVVNWVQHYVGAHFSQNQAIERHEFVHLSQIEPTVLSLLSLCSRQNNDLMLQRGAWEAGLSSLGLPESTPEPVVELFHLRSFLPELNRSSPALKKTIWAMIQASILADKSVTEEEGLLSDALALILELPKPILIK